MKKPSEEEDSNKEFGYIKESETATEMAVKGMMKGLGWSRDKAIKAASDS